jgi:O-antigen/teichoic acid export membrane protein
MAMSRLLRDSAWTFGAEVATAAATFAGGVLVARATGAEGKGVFTLATGFAAVFAGVIGIRWDRPTGHFLARNPADLPAILGSVLALAVCSTFGGLALWWGWPAILSTTVLRGMDPRCITLAVGLIGTHFLFVTIPAIYGGLREFRARATFISASAVPLLVPAAILARSGAHDVRAYVAAYLFACAVIYGGWLVALAVRRRVTPRFDPRLLSRMLRWGAFSWVSLLMDCLTIRLDIFLLNYLTSALEVGVYSVAVGIAMRIATIPNILGHVLFHRVSAKEVGGGATTARVFRLTTVAMVGSGVALALVGRVLIVPLYGHEFGGSVALLLVMIPAAIFWGLFRLLAADIEGRGRPGLVSACSLVGSATIVLLDLLWIPRHGAMGAAWASVVAYGAAFACATLAFRHSTGTRLYGAREAGSGDVVALAAALGGVGRAR